MGTLGYALLFSSSLCYRGSHKSIDISSYRVVTKWESGSPPSLRFPHFLTKIIRRS